MKTSIRFFRQTALIGSLLLTAVAQAQSLGSDFSSSYTVTNLGSVPGLPSNYGGLTFLNNNTLLIGGAANTANGSLYSIAVVRNASNHITGFGAATAVRFGTSIGEYNDGGVTFGPNGVLFTSRWPINGLGQTKLGSPNEDKVIELGPLGVASSNAAVGIVPTGFAGAGDIKLSSWSGGQWYSGDLVPDGNGTFDLANLAQVDLNPDVAGIQNLPGGPEGFVYIDGANAGFGVDSLLVSEYSSGNVTTFQLDSNGNPLVSTRRTFLSGLTGAEGAAIDPVTGDFLFSTFGGGSRVVAVSGFLAPPPIDPEDPIDPIDPPPVDPVDPLPIPEPQTYALMLLGLAAVLAAARRQRR